MRFLLDAQALSALKKHVDLYNYGIDIVASSNAVLTPYGLVERMDGELIQCPEKQAEYTGMEMISQ